MEMRKIVRYAACVAAACFLIQGLFAATAAAADEETARQVVDSAYASLLNFKNDPDMGWFRTNVRNARGVFIVPRLVKAGFILGGSGGTGVFLARDEKTGEWSYPAFYTMGTASVGFQAGLEVAEVVLMFMTPRGIDSMLSSSFKLGADVSVAAGPVGAGAKVQTADVLAFSRAKGVYGGVSLEGAVISTRDALNTQYYGKPVRAPGILIRKEVANPHADLLLDALRKAAP